MIAFALALALAQDEFEPNDSFDQARALETDASVRISLHAKGDADFFRVELAAPGYVRISAEGIPKGISPQITVYSVDRVKVATASLSREMTVRCAKGTVFLSIADVGDRSSPDPFTVKQGFREEFDKYEPNDKPTESREIPIGSAVPLILFPEEDVDWFQIDVDHDSVLEAAALGGPEKGGVVLEVRDANDRPLARTSDRAPLCWRAAPGTYRLVAREVYRRSFEEPFRLVVAKAAMDDQGEPNDQREQATPIEADRPLWIQLRPAGDVDWFVVTLDQRGTLRCVPARVPEGGRPQVAFFDEGGRELGGESVRAGPGRVWMRVADRSPLASSAHGFDGTVEFLRELDSWEPNDGPDNAARVSLPDRFALALAPGDEDWFRFEVPHEGILTLHATFPSNPVSLVVDLRRAEDGAVRRVDMKFPGLRLQRVVPGSYLLRVAKERETGAVEPLTFDLGFVKKGARIDLGFRLVAAGIDASAEELEQLRLLSELGGDELLGDSDVDKMVPKPPRPAGEAPVRRPVEPPPVPRKSWPILVIPFGAALVASIVAVCLLFRRPGPKRP